MELGPEARPIGAIVTPIMSRIKEAMNKTPPPRIPHLQPGVPLTDDIPAHTPALIAQLRHAAFQAKDRGATIAVTTHGMLVRKEGKCELIPFSDVEGGVLDRALNRVAPYDWELDG